MTRPSRIHIHHAHPELFAEALRPLLPGAELVCWTDDDAFVRGLPEAEALLAYQPPRGHWGRAERLRLLQMSGAGIDALLPAPDLPAHVRVANARGIHGDHMAEFALAMILAFEKRIPTWVQYREERRWQLHRLGVLGGKTVGVLGLGAIGTEVARRCRALGLHVIGTRRGGAPVAEADRVYRPDETDAVLAASDFVVVLLPLTAETRGFLSAERLALLRRDAVLVNLARGGIVDEAALAERLAKGELRGAALDVFDTEPLPKSSPLWELPNVILTPHVSGWFPGYAERLAEIFVDNLDRLAAGTPLRNEIDPARGY